MADCQTGKVQLLVIRLRLASVQPSIKTAIRHESPIDNLGSLW